MDPAKQINSTEGKLILNPKNLILANKSKIKVKTSNILGK